MRLQLAAIALAMSGPALAAPTVYVMRHLERAGSMADDPPLTAAGAAQAQRLVGWFAHDHPVAIFVTATRRARDTAAPLAERFGITLQYYNPHDPAALARTIAAIDGPVLIVGHSNTVPGLVAAFGAPPPHELADDDYGRIWIVSHSDSRVVRIADLQPK